MSLLIRSFVLALVYVLEPCAANTERSGYKLEIENYNKNEIVGCYGQTEGRNVGICFAIRDDYIHISTKDGGLLSVYWKLGEKFHYMQSIDRASFRYFDFEVPLPGTLRKLMNSWFTGQILHGFLGIHSELAKNHRHLYDCTAMANKTVTVRLLSEASKILQGRFELPQTSKVLLNFHLLSLGLVSAYKLEQGSNIQQPRSADTNTNRGKAFAPVHTDMGGYGSGRAITECEEAERPIGKDCFGMCGPHCWCWYWICGDCCIHHGCYEHDLCCQHNYLSTHCLFPLVFGFSCRDGYLGYPECLRE